MLVRSVFGYQFHKDLTMESWPYMRSWSGAYCDLILHIHRFTEADMEFPYESANLEYIFFAMTFPKQGDVWIKAND